MLSYLPPASQLQLITQHHTISLLDRKRTQYLQREKSNDDTNPNKNQKSVIDAEDVARLTIAIFLDYLFGIRQTDINYDKSNEVNNNHNNNNISRVEKERNQNIEELYTIFVNASWEWRKEISVRGKASKQIKLLAIEQLLTILSEPNKYTNNKESSERIQKIYSLYGDKWKLSKYFSLILQPFLISPCINTGQ